MSREIKFEYVAKYYDGEIIRQPYTLDEIQEGRPNAISKSSSWELLARRQYTGLKDKNGVEIYEGDIVQVDSDYYESFVGAVEYFKEAAKWSMHGQGSWIDFEFIESCYEVIGNIHSNPELLK